MARVCLRKGGQQKLTKCEGVKTEEALSPSPPYCGVRPDCADMPRHVHSEVERWLGAPPPPSSPRTLNPCSVSTSPSARWCLAFPCGWHRARHLSLRAAPPPRGPPTPALWGWSFSSDDGGTWTMGMPVAESKTVSPRVQPSGRGTPSRRPPLEGPRHCPAPCPRTTAAPAPCRTAGPRPRPRAAGTRCCR